MNKLPCYILYWQVYIIPAIINLKEAQINIKVFITAIKYLNTTIIYIIIVKVYCQKDIEGNHILQFLFSKNASSLGNGWKWKIAYENIRDLHVKKVLFLCSVLYDILVHFLVFFTTWNRKTTYCTHPVFKYRNSCI